MDGTVRGPERDAARASPAMAPIANVARGWGQSAAGTALGTDRTGLSAALWTLDGATREVSAGPNADTHSLGILLQPARCETFVDGRRVFEGRTGAGAANLIRAGERPRGVMRDGRQMLHVYLPGPLIRDLVEAEGAPARAGGVDLDPLRWTIDPVIGAAAGAILDEMRGPAPFGRLRIDALGMEIGIRLLRAHSNFAGRGPRGPEGLSATQLARAVAVMEAGLDRDLALAEVAGAVGLSPAHFSRAFRRSAGAPPFRWLRRRRIERAKDLLADPRNTLVGVALAVGFAAQPQFTTAFRRETGLTPDAWRRCHRL